MAMIAIRIFRKSNLKQRIRCSFSNFSTVRDRSSDLSSAFWDPEGATVVGEDQTGSLDYLKKDPIPKVALSSSEVIRWTNFGHVRLDSDNHAVDTETHTPKQEEDALNYVDQQFFGSMRHTAKEEPKVGKITFTASDVPSDTNPIDQQYFYPNNSKSDTKSATSSNNIPSAEELDFKDNQIDDQYFGKSSREGPDKENTDPNKLPAYVYLRSLNQTPKSAEESTDGTAKSKNAATLRKDGGVAESSKGQDDLIPNFRKMSKEVIAYHLKKAVLYNKGKFSILNLFMFF